MRCLLILVFMFGGHNRATPSPTPLEHTAQVKFTRTATLWSARGFLNIESSVDRSHFDVSCRRLQALLEDRQTYSVYQEMTFHTTALAAKRVCATVGDRPQLFGATTPTGGTHSGSGRRPKRQLVIGAALGTVIRGVLWNEISDWVHDTTATDAIERLQKDMTLLHNYTTVFVRKIVTRFDKEFLIQAAITELGSHIAS